MRRWIRHTLFAASLASILFALSLAATLGSREIVGAGGSVEQSCPGAFDERLVALESAARRLERELERCREQLGDLAETRRPDPAAREPEPRDTESPQEDRGVVVDNALVASLVDEALAERQRVDRIEMAERSHELARLHEGPYGRHNHDVQSVSERLELTEAQTAAYHALLRRYSEQLTELRGQIRSSGAAWREGYSASRSLLQAEFEDGVLRMLTPEQSEAFAALPAWLGRITTEPAVREP